MRITFVLPFAGLAGGIRVVSSYTRRLAERGHEVHIVSTPLREPGTRERLSRMVRGARGPEMVSEQTFFDDQPVSHKVLDRFRPVVDDDLPDADVVVATWWETAEWVAGLSERKGAKALFIQGFELRGLPTDARLEATWRLPMQKIVVAKWLQDLAAERFDDPDALMVPNAVDSRHFTATPRGRQPEPRVGMVYSSDECKGADIAFGAVREAMRSMPELCLTTFGLRPTPGGSVLPPNTEYIQRPSQSRLPAIYASCDAWLFSSRQEGFGLPILEAMACRTPVIATPAGAAPQLLAGGGGRLVAPEDPADMARAIVELLSTTDEQWRRLSDEAHAIAAGYTWEDATNLFEGALKTTVERAREAGAATDRGSLRMTA